VQREGAGGPTGAFFLLRDARLLLRWGVGRIVRRWHSSQPPASQQPAFNIPRAVGALLVLLIAAHLARMAVAAQLSDEVLVRYAFNPALYSPAFLSVHHLDPGPLWLRVAPFVSYMFLHGDLTHLAVNCVWLLAFGPVVARRFGGAAFLAFFFLCGIVAASVQLACSWGQYEPVIGASGAISA